MTPILNRNTFEEGWAVVAPEQRVGITCTRCHSQYVVEHDDCNAKLSHFLVGEQKAPDRRTWLARLFGERADPYPITKTLQDRLEYVAGCPVCTHQNVVGVYDLDGPYTQVVHSRYDSQ